MITESSLKLKFLQSMGFSDYHHAIMRDEELGVQCETITRKNAYGEFMKGKSFYFIDNDEREFLSIEELIEAYNEKFPRDGDNPDFEVTYVKVVKKRTTDSDNKEGASGIVVEYNPKK